MLEREATYFKQDRDALGLYTCRRGVAVFRQVP